MLIYHPESDALFWDEDFTFEGADGALCSDVSEEIWAVERAVDENLGMPDAERHLAYLRDLVEITREVDMTWALAHPDDEFWQGL